MSETGTAVQKLPPMSVNIYNSDSEFQRAGNIARTLAASTLVPEIYRNSPANCMIALEMSARLKMPPFMVMQQMHIIHGKPSFSAAFIIGRINISGQFSRLKFKYEGEGDSRKCHAFATDREDGELVEGPECTIKMAKDEGWYGKNGSKWPNMPDLMLTYRAAAFFARVNCPDILLGMQTTEELQDFMVGANDDDSLSEINETIKGRQTASTPAPENAQNGPSEPRQATDIPYEEVGKENSQNGPAQAPEPQEQAIETLVPAAQELENAKKAYAHYKEMHEQISPAEPMLSPQGFIALLRHRSAHPDDDKLPVEVNGYNIGDMPPMAPDASENDGLT